MKVPESVLCDIDGVLGDVSVPVVAAINREYGTDYRPEDWSSWEWPMERLAVLAGLDVPAAAAWLFSIEHVSQSPPLPEAQHVLRLWSEQGTRINVATSRAPVQREMTLEWLAKHYPFIDPENIQVRMDKSIGGAAFKQQQAERLRPDYYFEDEGAAIKTLLAVWPENLRAIIQMIDQPWNQGFSELDAYRTNWGAFR
jgi:hypothetical protein